jgi:hypothetical protein
MDRLAELKGALAVTDGPSDRLRTRALAPLTATTPSVRPVRRPWVAVLAAGAAVVVGGAIAIGALSGGLSAPDRPGPSAVQLAAFGVSVNADGSVTFTANDVVDPVAATQALNNAGIAGRVINDITPGCPTTGDDIAPADLYPDNTISRGLGASGTVTLRSSDYPAGGGLLVVVTSRGEETGRSGTADPVSVAILAFDNASAIPTCVDFADPGTGGPA